MTRYDVMETPSGMVYIFDQEQVKVVKSGFATRDGATAYIRDMFTDRTADRNEAARAITTVDQALTTLREHGATIEVIPEDERTGDFQWVVNDVVSTPLGLINYARQKAGAELTTHTLTPSDSARIACYDCGEPATIGVAMHGQGLFFAYHCDEHARRFIEVMPPPIVQIEAVTIDQEIDDIARTLAATNTDAELQERLKLYPKRKEPEMHAIIQEEIARRAGKRPSEKPIRKLSDDQLFKMIETADEKGMTTRARELRAEIGRRYPNGLAYQEQAAEEGQGSGGVIEGSQA